MGDSGNRRVDRRKRLAMALAMLVMVIALPLSSLAGEGNRGSFISISDLHFDPFSDPSLVNKLESADFREWKQILESSKSAGIGSYGKDTSFALLRSTLEAMRSVDPTPDFIIFTGDFLAHDFAEHFREYGRDKSPAAYRRFVEKTIRFLASEFFGSYPETTVVPALGNNDSDCGDYGVEAGGGFLKIFAGAWSPLVEKKGAGASFSETFPVGGYYSIPNPALKGHRFVVLNANLFSSKAKYCNPVERDDHGAEELCWLDWTLYRSRLKGERVWILYHEPVGVDVYATLRGKGKCRENIRLMLKEGYNAALLRIMEYNSSVIEASFSGHTHMDDFRLIPGGTNPLLFTHITPAVSPVFGTNPAFQLFVFDRNSGAITDYATYSLNNFDVAKSVRDARWEKEYDYGRIYGQKGYSPSALGSLYGILANSVTARSDYARLYSSGATTLITDENWKAYWCAIGNMNADAFSSCFCEGK